VLTLRVRLRVWIPTEDVPRLQKAEFFSGLRRSELNVDTVVPDASFSGAARATGPAAAAAQQSAWREIQLLGEARDAFEAFAQLEQRVEEVDDVVLAFPMAKVRGRRRRQRGGRSWQRGVVSRMRHLVHDATVRDALCPLDA
jgi:hypothetical protein